jgi:hypothetical protein
MKFCYSYQVLIVLKKVIKLFKSQPTFQILLKQNHERILDRPME